MVKAAREITEYASVLERIDAVLSIMGGYGGTYGKGRPLVDALEDAAQGAILYGTSGSLSAFSASSLITALTPVGPRRRS